MNKEDILKRSREENSKGDELVIQQKENARNHGYSFATTCLCLLAISCYLGITSGTVAIFEKPFALQDVLWLVVFLTSAIEYGSKYLYLRQKRHFIYTIFWLVGVIACLITMFRS